MAVPPKIITSFSGGKGRRISREDLKDKITIYHDKIVDNFRGWNLVSKFKWSLNNNPKDAEKTVQSVLESIPPSERVLFGKWVRKKMAGLSQTHTPKVLVQVVALGRNYYTDAKMYPHLVDDVSAHLLDVDLEYLLGLV